MDRIIIVSLIGLFTWWIFWSLFKPSNTKPKTPSIEKKTAAPEQIEQSVETARSQRTEPIRIDLNLTINWEERTITETKALTSAPELFEMNITFNQTDAEPCKNSEAAS
ncbi:hypothetical protein [Magnetococcus sp. PR-3]|uniref:hypothetical protein n=1 Tax=Magnetococcus sp. PR-3 TaxID=3120355 RepID=UPI002FCE3506